MSSEPDSSYIEKVVEFYNQNGQDFYQRTAELDMAELYDRFLPYLPDEAVILDAGCGSGRDALNFKKFGYEVSAFDASSTLSNLASEKTGLAVRTIAFNDMDYKEDFDGVWCCASLLHLKGDDLKNAFKRIHRAMKPEGICFQSFKAKAPEADPRFFNAMTLEELVAFNESSGLFELIESWESEDVRQGQQTEVWANVIARKVD
jgi:SAM-dependent methyltransferase